MQKYPVNENVILNEDALSYYLLGVVMSDGHVCTQKRHKSISIFSKDLDWLEEIRNVVSPGRPVYTYSDDSHELNFTSLNLVEWFHDKGSANSKSLTLEFPKVPRKYLADLVRGYFDGDGSVSIASYNKTKNNKIYTYTKLSAYICTASEIFAKSLCNELDELGIKHGWQRVKPPTEIKGRLVQNNAEWQYRVTFADQTAIKFFNWTHYDPSLLALKRKLQLIDRARAIYANRPGQGWNKK